MPRVPPASRILRQSSLTAGWSETAAPTRPTLRLSMIPCLHLGPEVLQRAFPGRAVDEARGAEAAAPGAAPARLHQEHLAPFALGGQEVAVGRVGGQLRQMGGRDFLGIAGPGSKAARVPSAW